jgi:hypothetical protein
MQRAACSHLSLARASRSSGVSSTPSSPSPLPLPFFPPFPPFCNGRLGAWAWGGVDTTVSSKHAGVHSAQDSAAAA